MFHADWDDTGFGREGREVREDKDCLKCSFWNHHRAINKGTDCLAPKEWRDTHLPFSGFYCFVPIGGITAWDEREVL